MTLAQGLMCISVCPKMEKMYLWHQVNPLAMECPKLGRSSWLEFFIIFLLFWHLQHQFQIGYFTSIIRFFFCLGNICARVSYLFEWNIHKTKDCN